MSLSKHASKELTFELTSYAVALETMCVEEQKKKKTRTYTLTVDKGKQVEFDMWWSALAKVVGVHCDEPPPPAWTDPLGRTASTVPAFLL